MPSSSPFAKRYKAFISYSHADNRAEGRKWADWLHHELETYRVPDGLVGQTNQYGEPVPERIYPVFQDEKELSANADLSGSLNSALDHSDYLVYLSSPQSARSVYVQEEIRHFKMTGRGSKIIALILRGEPEYGEVQSEQQCFPDVLRFGVDAEGRLLKERHEEALAADVRLPHSSEEGFTSPVHYRRVLQQQNLSAAQVKQKVAEYEERLNLAKLKIIATILGVPLSELTQRDQAYQLELVKRKNRNIKRVAGVVSVLALAAAGAGVYAWQQKNEAQKNLAQSLYVSGINKLAQNEYGEPAAYIAAAARQGNLNAVRFGESMLAMKEDMLLLPNINSAVFSPDGRLLAGFADKGNNRYVLQLWDAHRRRLLEEVSAIGGNSTPVLLFDGRNRIYTRAEQGGFVRYDPAAKRSEPIPAPSDNRDITLQKVSADGRWLIYRLFGSGMLHLLDSQTPNRVVVFRLPENALSVSVAEISDDGKLALLGWAAGGRSEGVLVRLDSTEDKLPLLPFALSGELNGAVFAADGKQVLLHGRQLLALLNTADGRLRMPEYGGRRYDWFGFNADGSVLAVNAQGYTVFPRSGAAPKVRQAELPEALRRSLEAGADLSPDQTQQLVRRNKQIYLKNLGTSNLLVSEIRLPADIRLAETDPSGSYLFVLAADGKSVGRIHIESRTVENGWLKLPEEAAYFRMAGEFLMTVSPAKTVRFYRLQDGRPVGGAVAAQARTILLNRDNTRFFARSGADNFVVWNISDGREVLRYRHPKPDSSFATDNAFRYLVAADKKQWQLIDLATQKILLSADEAASNAVFSPDGRWLALAKNNGQTDVYALSSLKKMFSLNTVSSPVLLFSPDGEILAAASDTKHLRLWHTRSGETYGQQVAMASDARLLAFSKDSSRLFVQAASEGSLVPSVKTVDTEGGNLISLPFAEGMYNSLKTVADEQRIVAVQTLSENVVVHIWQMPGSLNLSAEQLATDLEAFYGRKYNRKTGTVEAYAAQQQFGTWYFQDIYTRPIAPDSRTTVPEAVSRLLPVQTAEQVQQLGSVYFYHPLAKAGLAEYFGRQPETQALSAYLAALAKRQAATIGNAAVREQTLSRLKQ